MILAFKRKAKYQLTYETIIYVAKKEKKNDNDDN